MAKAQETTTKTKTKTTPVKKSSQTALPPKGSAEYKAMVLKGLIKE